MVSITTRAELGWPKFGGTNSKTNLGMVVHYDGNNQGLNQPDHGKCVKYWQKTRRFHMVGRGWSDIGYSYGVCPHGEIFEGRGYGKVQAAQKSDRGGIIAGNERYVSVTFMSGPDEKPTSMQIKAFRDLRKKFMDAGQMSKHVMGHKQFSDTSCPGGKLYELVMNGSLAPVVAKSRPTLRLTDPMMYGDAVREAQRLLGMQVEEIDGWYGKKTEAKVRRFQEKNGLSVDGVVGKNTWKALLK